MNLSLQGTSYPPRIWEEHPKERVEHPLTPSYEEGEIQEFPLLRREGVEHPLTPLMKRRG